MTVLVTSVLCDIMPTSINIIIYSISNNVLFIETCVKDGSRGDDSMTSATEQLTSPTGYCQNHVETFAAKLAVAADDYNRYLVVF